MEEETAKITINKAELKSALISNLVTQVFPVLERAIACSVDHYFETEKDNENFDVSEFMMALMVHNNTTVYPVLQQSIVGGINQYFSPVKDEELKKGE